MSAAEVICIAPFGDPWRYLALVCKQTYRLDVTGELAPLEGAQIEWEPKIRELDDDAILLEDCDLFAPLRTGTDVLVNGSAYARGARQVETTLRVGSFEKRVRVCGKRRIHLGYGGSLFISEPEPFDELRLDWTEAYGGRDRAAEARRPSQGDADDELPAGLVIYPRNRFGRGFYVGPPDRTLDGSPAPRMDDPRDPVLPERLGAATSLDWLDLPIAAGYGAVDGRTFPRAQFVLPFDFTLPRRPVYEVSLGALTAADLLVDEALSDMRVFSAAPPGQHIAGVPPGERIAIRNLHPVAEILEFGVPTPPRRMWIEPPAAGRRIVHPELKTIIVEPDLDRVSFVWTGRIPIAGRFDRDDCASMARGVEF